MRTFAEIISKKKINLIDLRYQRPLTKKESLVNRQEDKQQLKIIY